MDTFLDYQKDAQALLGDVRDNFCKFCTDPQKEGRNIDLENPLKCDCSCKKIEHLLTLARKIIEEG